MVSALAPMSFGERKAGQLWNSAVCAGQRWQSTGERHPEWREVKSVGMAAGEETEGQGLRKWGLQADTPSTTHRWPAEPSD